MKNMKIFIKHVIFHRVRMQAAPPTPAGKFVTYPARVGMDGKKILCAARAKIYMIIRHLQFPPGVMPPFFLIYLNSFIMCF